MLISKDEAVTRLSKGDIVALPTETVYGLAGLALCEDSVLKIFNLKGRPQTNPLIVHVSCMGMAQEISHFNDWAETLTKQFWPGPLTIVLPKKDTVPDLITAGRDTVAMRLPAHPTFRQILKELDQPLAAPSANPANRTSPTMAVHLLDLYENRCPPYVDGGRCQIGLESTVIDLSNDKPEILRFGPLAKEDFVPFLPGVEILTPDQKFDEEDGQNVQKNVGHRAPGQSRTHYAPRTPLQIYSSIELVKKQTIQPGKDIGLAWSDGDEQRFKVLGLEVIKLSQNENPQEIAHLLYDSFAEADKIKADRIHAVLLGENGSIYDAINDRLSRAAQKHLK